MSLKNIALPTSSRSDLALSFLLPLPLAAFLGPTTANYNRFFKFFTSVFLSQTKD